MTTFPTSTPSVAPSSADGTPHGASSAKDPFDLSGSVALVTGASRGIGRAAARMLAARGAAVVISSNEPDACADLAAELRAQGRAASGVGCDVSDRAQVADLVAAAVGEFGRLDAVVSNVGIIPHPGPLAEVDELTYDRVMTTNLRSAWWLAVAALPHLSADGGGSIVFTASIAALRGSSAVGLYSLTKAGLVSLARNLAVEWGPRGVRVNAIAPGLVATDMTRATVENPDLVARRIADSPLRRIGTPDDIAGAVTFLVSPAAGFVTGHTLVVDGGVTANLGNWTTFLTPLTPPGATARPTTGGSDGADEWTAGGQDGTGLGFD